jgi:RNA polymerase subunit RPABC4/transcription elongation factor Spt4
MNCTNCKQHIDDKASFCSKCGTSVGVFNETPESAQVVCAGCGAPLSPGSSTCAVCGRANDVTGTGEKTKLTFNIGNKTKTLNLGDVGNLGFTVKTGDKARAINLRNAAKAASKASESVKPGGTKRSKVIAVILAIYGPLTWIYTYKYDKSKLWTGLGLFVVGGIAAKFGGFVLIAGVYLWAFILAATRGDEFYKNY